MSALPLTDRYVRVLRDRGLGAAQLLPRERIPAIIEAFYQQRCLAAPVLFGHAEHARLMADLAATHDALASLPAKLFGGDLAAFARAVGLSRQQIELAVRTQTGVPVTRFARADLYAEDDGFRLLEYNVGSTVGLIEAGLLNAALMAHPVLAGFAAEHRLGFPDMVGECLDSVRLECGLDPGARPVIAICDWPSEFRRNAEPLRLFAELHEREYGVTTVPTHLGRLEYRGGRVWAEGHPVDVVYRIFLLQQAAMPGGTALVAPLLAAAERGEVAVFTPLGCQIFSSKTTLSMLSDEDHRELFDADTLAALDRVLPWTRACRRGEVRLPSGERAELLEYAVAARTELTLKPALLHGGSGVLPGWETEPAEWAARVRAALTGGFVLQRRVRPRPQVMPTPGEGFAAYAMNLGVFSMPSAPGGYGGAALRAAPVADNVTVLSINAASSVLLGCAMHQASPD